MTKACASPARASAPRQPPAKTAAISRRSIAAGTARDCRVKSGRAPADTAQKPFIAVMTLPDQNRGSRPRPAAHRPEPCPLLLRAGLLLGVHAVKDALGADAGAFGTVVSAWFEPVAFLGCGLAVLWRARGTERRAPWLLVGAGLCLYASGNVFYNLAYSKCPAFPSPADGLWLSL